MTDDLSAWLRAQLDDDERVARATADHRQRRGELRWTQCDPEREPGLIGDGCGGVVTYDEGNPNEWQAAHIARHDPARVLAEVDAKRRLLAWLERRDDWATDNNLWTWDSTEALALLALPYADRPGYRDEWRP